jgi:exodeoxyribonuclease VII large subunit
VRAVAASEIPVISAVGHETDFTLCDFAADKRAPTPSAAAELAVPNAEDLMYTVQDSDLRIRRAMSARLSLLRERLNRLSGSRVLQNPQTVIDDKRMALINGERLLNERMQALLREKRAMLGETGAKLGALDPLAVLARGYGAVFDGNGRVVKSVDDTAVGESVMLSLSDGRIRAVVTEIEKNTKEETNGYGRKEKNDL